MKKAALFSPRKIYRHWLSRTWDESKGMVTIIGLNPSTADENIDDPTIRRCIDFVKSWGYGGFYMVNLFDFRSTNPAVLLRKVVPWSMDNDLHIDQCIGKSKMVVFAWGAFPCLSGRNDYIIKKYPNAYCLGKTKTGQPRHPLYLKKDTPLQLFTEVGCCDEVKVTVEESII